MKSAVGAWNSDCLVEEQSWLLNFNVRGLGSHRGEPLGSAFKKQLLIQIEELQMADAGPSGQHHILPGQHQPMADHGYISAHWGLL